MDSYTAADRTILLILTALIIFRFSNLWPANIHVVIRFLSALATIGLLVAWLSYFQTGSLNYGAQKFEFIFISIAIPSMLGILSRIHNSRSNTIYEEMRIYGFSVILALVLTYSGTVLRWIDLGRASTWPPTPRSGWPSIVVTGGLNAGGLDDLPIGCGEATEDSARLSLNYNTYLCTRILSSIAGLENAGIDPLIQWQLRSGTDLPSQFIIELPENIKKRKILILNPDGTINRTENLSRYMPD